MGPFFVFGAVGGTVSPSRGHRFPVAVHRQARDWQLRGVHLEPTYPERSLEAVQAAFAQLVEDGRIRVTPAEAAAGELPAWLGPVVRDLAARFGQITLVEAEIDFSLTRWTSCDDELGGWRIDAQPEELDVRLVEGVAVGTGAPGDAVFDATWTPRGDEVALHSTLLHFLVRSTLGNRA